MERGTRRMASEVCGAVIGAGFASGREVVTFFARFGPWSWAAVGAAVLTIAGVSYGLLRRAGGRTPLETLCMGKGWLGWCWRAAFILLMTVTGGAMVAGAGEISALALPIDGAYWIGMIATLLAAVLLTDVCLTVLPRISGVMIGVLGLILVMGLLLPSYSAALVTEGESDPSLAFGSVLHGICYGGFNMALAAPLLCEAGERMTDRQKCRGVIATAMMLGILLAASNALLQKHALLQSEEMPMIRLLSAFGKFGYFLGCISLYLAVFTTLLAALRGLRSLCPPAGWPGRLLQAAAVACVALLGFTGVVGKLYPVPGGLCFLLLIIGRWAGRGGRPLS